MSLSKWEDGEVNTCLWEMCSHFILRTRDQGTHTVRRLDVLMSLTLTFHFLPIPEPFTLLTLLAQHLSLEQQSLLHLAHQ